MKSWLCMQLSIVKPVNLITVTDSEKLPSFEDLLLIKEKGQIFKLQMARFFCVPGVSY